MRQRYPIIVLISLLAFSKAYCQEYDQFHDDIVSECNFDTLQHHLQTFEDLGVKETGTMALTQTYKWIKDQYESYGYTDIDTHTFNHMNHDLDNLIVTKQGTEFPDTYLIIDGHYDTRTGPGVNDNGTGTAILLEMARLLKDIPTKYSIRFIHFSAEEDGLIGSTRYVEDILVPQNDDILLVFNIDEVGGVAGMTNNTIVCERDESAPTSNNASSWAYTDSLATLMQTYSNLNTSISYAYGSDYVPFQNNGYIITGLFEENYSPHGHTTNDILANLDMDYTFEVAKGALGACLFFSKAYDPTISVDKNDANQIVSIYPNPATNFIHFEASASTAFRIYNMNGQLVYSGHSSDPSSEIDLTDFSDGLYSITYIVNNIPGSKNFLVRK